MRAVSPTAAHNDVPHRNGSSTPVSSQNSRYFAEQSERGAAALLNTILGTVTQGIALFDANRKLVVFNQHYPELFGYPDDFLRVGINFEEILRFNAERVRRTPAEADLYVRQRLAELESPVPIRREHVRPDGKVIAVRFTPTPDGGFINTYVDITDRKRAEQAVVEQAHQLQQAMDELQRSNAELEQFAYVASHDLQEPLRMVGSYCQLLQRRYAAKLDQDANEFIDFAVEGAKRMQSLINDLLLYSRVGTKGKEFVSTELDQVLNDALANLTVAVEEAGAVITRDPLPRVKGDGIQLIQLMQNLIGNALKFRRDEPVRIHIGARREGDRWLISVTDNGIGIDPQYAERIFMIFQRLHTRKEYPGTGIGLSVCKKIVERHGGQISVEPAPTQGSVFEFSMPAEE